MARITIPPGDHLADERAELRTSQNALQNIEQPEGSLWAAADILRANYNLPSNEYFMPVLGVIFLRHAAKRHDAASRHIAREQAAGTMPKGANLGAALVEAMNAIERDFPPQPAAQGLPQVCERRSRRSSTGFR
jgi:hypothetical protein